LTINLVVELAKELQEKRLKLEADIMPSLESRLRKMEDVNQIFGDIQRALTEWYKMRSLQN
jgi:hypothetical protein